MSKIMEFLSATDIAILWVFIFALIIYLYHKFVLSRAPMMSLNNIKAEQDNLDELEKTVIDIDRIRLILSDKVNIVEKINDIMDSLIKEAVDRYMILNTTTEDLYINKAQAEEMELYCFGMVKKNMTPDIINTLKLIYVINTESDLDELLKLKIKIYLLAVMININSPK